MNVLLDTHVFIWLDTQPEKLSPIALDLCSDGSNQLYLSMASKYPSIINLTNFTQDFCSFSRRINRRIAGYVTIYATLKMRKKTSKMLD